MREITFLCYEIIVYQALGIVIKQTIKGSFYAYLGVIIGGVNVAILLPLLFSEAQIGLINILVSVSAILGQISCLGGNGIISYFFPRFHDKASEHKDFFSFVWIYSMIGFAVFYLLFLLFGEHLLAGKSADVQLMREYSVMLFPLTFFTLAFLLVDTFASSTLNATIGAFYKELVMRLVNTALIVLFYSELIDFRLFMWLYVANFAVPVIAITIHLLKQREISLRWPSKTKYLPHLKTMASIGVFFILNGLSNSLAIYIDKLMITYYLGLKDTGIYSITNFIGTVVRIPRLAMGKISTPIIAQSLNDGDYQSLEKFFRLSVLSQVIVGFLIFIPIWINIDIFLALLPPSYLEGKWVVFHISLSFLITCFLGIGIQVIQLSKHYKLITYLNLVAGVAVVVLNALFIPLWGISGAAFATFVSKLLLVVLFLLLLYKRFRFRVLFADSALVILISSLVIGGAVYLPVGQFVDQKFINGGINIILRTIAALAVWALALKVTGLFRRVKFKEIV